MSERTSVSPGLRNLSWVVSPVVAIIAVAGTWFISRQLVAVCFVAIIFGIDVYRRFSGLPFALQRWAKDNGFRILHFEYRALFQGPFAGRSSRRRDMIYYVRIKDFHERERSGWVRCSGDEAEVEWEKEP
jgi:hypothetical protein